MELYIDDQLCDMVEKVAVPIALDTEQLCSPEGQRSGRTVELWLPRTARNDALLGSSGDIYAVRRFNEQHHKAHIEEQGVRLLEGTAYLLTTQVGKGKRSGYQLRITDGGEEWIRQAVYKSLAEADIDLEMELTMPSINALLEDEDKAVRWLPIFRNREAEAQSVIGSTTPQQVMLIDDFHPFISAAHLVRTFFDTSGYRLESRFFESELFRSLYISGEFASKQVEEQLERCGFCARRQSAGEATANQLGRVYATPSMLSHSVGNIVDTASPTTLDEQGKPMSDTYATHDSFCIDEEGFACFAPTMDVQAGFKLHLEYTTDYRIASRERLTGFDEVEALPATKVKFSILNTHEDQREKALPATTYRAIVFDHTEGRSYRIIESTPSAAATIAEWKARSTLVTTEADMTQPAFSLYYHDAEMDFGEWHPYDKDWALYFGYVEECGTTKVKLDLRIPPQEVAAGSRLRLDKIWFGGAEEGMRIRIATECRLEPYFSTMPGYGSRLGFKDVAPRNIRFVELLEALATMFNLIFYTDAASKRVYIEPMEDFYEQRMVDWSGKIDHTKPISLCDAAIDRPQRYSFGYRAGDAASERYNVQHDTTLGKWRFNIPLYGTNLSEKQMISPLFTTTLNATGLYAAAPSASVMQVDTSSSKVGAEQNVTPRIVRYLGLRPLPEGELWPATAANSYPLAAFLMPEEGVNLCYEDHDDEQGLHRYYDERLRRERDRQRLTLTLQLSPTEINQLFNLEGDYPTMRSLFRLTIDGESSLFRLERVECVESDGSSVECQFLRTTAD